MDLDLDPPSFDIGLTGVPVCTRCPDLRVRAVGSSFSGPRPRRLGSVVQRVPLNSRLKTEGAGFSEKERKRVGGSVVNTRLGVLVEPTRWSRLP